MDKFSELISKGVAQFNYTVLNGENANQCPLCREYNNIFSIATDTHMSCTEDGTRVITGHIIKDKKSFDQFIWSNQYKGVNFGTTGYFSFADWMNRKNLVGEYGIINGDDVYIVSDRVESTNEPEGGTSIDAVGQTVGHYISYTVGENKIPQPIRLLATDYRYDSISECIKSTPEETAKAFNKSHFVRGNNWCVANLSDGKHIVAIIEGKNYKI